MGLKCGDFKEVFLPTIYREVSLYVIVPISGYKYTLTNKRMCLLVNWRLLSSSRVRLVGTI